MFGETPLVMVEEHEALVAVCETLTQQAVIGIDTESDSFHHYQEKVCLIQLSGLNADYIVDPLKVDDLSPLKTLLEDPDTKKILHGGDYDVVCLKRDYDIRLTNLFDTMIAGQFLAFPRIGLADLIRHFFGEKIDKKYQRYDWSRRPLLDEHLQYARGDTHWLLAVYEVLQHKLEMAGRSDAVAEECVVLEEREWTGRVAHASDFLRVKGSKTLDDPGKRVLRALWAYRDQQAQAMDRPAFKVMPGDALLRIARDRPADLDALGGIVRENSSLFKRHGDALVAAVHAGLEDTRPVPRPPPKESSPRRSRRPRNDQLMGRLKNWRNAMVKREGIAPVVVANNQLLKEIATQAPTTPEALAAIDGIRNWQVKTYGDEIIALVSKVTAMPEKKAAPKRKRRRRKKAEDAADGPTGAEVSAAVATEVATGDTAPETAAPETAADAQDS